MNDERQGTVTQNSYCGFKFRDLKEYDEVLPLPASTDIKCHQLISEKDFFSFIRNIDNGWRLGLCRSIDGGLKLSHFSGAVWIREPSQDTTGIPLVVAPKINNLDSVKMWLDVAASSKYSKKLENVFYCDPNQSTIAGVELPDVSLLQIAVFLKELSRFCQRDLRHDFTRTRENCHFSEPFTHLSP